MAAIINPPFPFALFQKVFQLIKWEISFCFAKAGK
jgi:hypothetical protein